MAAWLQWPASMLSAVPAAAGEVQVNDATRIAASWAEMCSTGGSLCHDWSLAVWLPWSASLPSTLAEAGSLTLASTANNSWLHEGLLALLNG